MKAKAVQIHNLAPCSNIHAPVNKVCTPCFTVQPGRIAEVCWVETLKCIRVYQICQESLQQRDNWRKKVYVHMVKKNNVKLNLTALQSQTLYDMPQVRISLPRTWLS